MTKKVKCVICGKEASILSAHLRVHGLTSEEYRRKYNAPTASEEWLARNSKRAKEDNPMFRPEVRAKVSANCSMKRPEVAKKNADARRGVKRTEEQRKRISEGRKGKGVGERNSMKRPEVREKLRKALAGKPKNLTALGRAKIKAMARAKFLGDKNPMKRPEVKEKVRLKLLGSKRPHLSGRNNPQWGKPSPASSGLITKFEYVSPIAGRVRAVGTYELRMCRILDKLGWKWEKEPDFFEYTTLEGKLSTYTPDFKVYKPDGTILYIETKGYFPEKDQHKCKSLQEKGINLLVLTKPLLRAFEDAVIGR